VPVTNAPFVQVSDMVEQPLCAGKTLLVIIYRCLQVNEFVAKQSMINTSRQAQ
jgi:hypothetical protein